MGRDNKNLCPLIYLKEAKMDDKNQEMQNYEAELEIKKAEEEIEKADKSIIHRILYRSGLMRIIIKGRHEL